MDREIMDGFININKEPGWTSHDVVAALRGILRQKKIGHTGTLDPAARGVLPVCLGKATRLAEYAARWDKRYRGEITFGIKTDSYDAEGKVTGKQAASHLKKEHIEAAFASFIGEIEQVPPMVSALKFRGERLYELARKGMEVERPARRVTVYGIETAAFAEGENPRLTVDIACSKGTYIRSLAHDLGRMLGSCAHLSALCRLAVGPFSLEEAYTVAQVKEMTLRQDRAFLLPMNLGVAGLPSLTVDGAQKKKLLCGVPVVLPAREDAEPLAVRDESGLLLGVGRIKDSLLFMDKVLAAE
ncbi:MAG: tRNA pseudouridine(55) synthase TruB [Clostridiales bacterium]|nr:tRNA pseudouridine(55) synthase TruB [Clostridiales bacterium]